MSHPDHAHICPHLSDARSARHGIFENAWYPGMQCVGMSVSKQPRNRGWKKYATLPGEKETATSESFLG